MERTQRSRALNLHRPTRREFLMGAGATVSAALLLDATAYDRHNVQVEHRTLQIRRLPTAFHGMRLVQISDFHHHGYAEDDYLHHVVQMVNALHADVVALTGDFITARGAPFGPWRKAMPVCAEILSGLTAPVRVCTLGNHDAIDAPFVLRCLREVKLATLYNTCAVLERKGDRMWIGGLADAYFDFPDLRRSIPNARPSEPVFLLGHEPDFADTVAAYGGVDVMLAGHSHGGQVRLPGLTHAWLPVMGRRYVEGLFQLGDLQLYVNRGIGAVHVPVRFNCPPEITLFTLRPAL